MKNFDYEGDSTNSGGALGMNLAAQHPTQSTDGSTIRDSLIHSSASLALTGMASGSNIASNSGNF